MIYCPPHQIRTNGMVKTKDATCAMSEEHLTTSYQDVGQRYLKEGTHGGITKFFKSYMRESGKKPVHVMQRLPSK